MLNIFTRGRRARAPSQVVAPLLPSVHARRASHDDQETVRRLASMLAGLGREAAELNGRIDDVHASGAAQREALERFSRELQQMLDANRTMQTAAQHGGESARNARAAVMRVADGVNGAVTTLKQVAGAAGEITQIALQTRLVAFNASVEAKRAGEAGRGFGVVADAVKDLAQKVEQSSKHIMSTVQELDQRIASLANDITDSRGSQGNDSFSGAFGRVEAGVCGIAQAADGNAASCEAAIGELRALEQQVADNDAQLADARQGVQGFLRLSESLIEVVATSGCETADTPYIEAVTRAARQVSEVLEAALSRGEITLEALFDEQYQPIAGSSPPQHMTRFVSLTDRLLPPIQEPLLEALPKVAFCAAVDRNGYLPTHNAKFSKPQGSDPIWNAAHCRNRRIFNDRTGLAAGQNTRQFLLQTYRRDMGGGNFSVMKDLSAPIVVSGRHWGGLRLAYQF